MFTEGPHKTQSALFQHFMDTRSDFQLTRLPDPRLGRVQNLFFKSLNRWEPMARAIRVGNGSTFSYLPNFSFLA